MTNGGLDLKIDTSDLEALAAAFPGMENIIFDEMDRAMDASLSIFEDQVKGRTPVNTGALRGSIIPEIHGDTPNFEGQIGTSLAHGIVIERGRTPGSTMPPIDAIEVWVRRQLGVSGEDSRQVAYAIALSISRKGIEGRFMFAEGFKAGEKAVLDQWEKVGDRAADRIEEKLGDE